MLLYEWELFEQILDLVFSNLLGCIPHKLSQTLDCVCILKFEFESDVVCNLVSDRVEFNLLVAFAFYSLFFLVVFVIVFGLVNSVFVTLAGLSCAISST